MFKQILLLSAALVISACSDSDQARIPSVDISGDGITFQVPLKSQKYILNVSSTNSIIEVQRGQKIDTILVSGVSNIISVRPESVIDKVTFTGSANKVVLERRRDKEGGNIEVPTQGAINGNVVEFCKRGTVPDATGGCVPDR